MQLIFRAAAQHLFLAWADHHEISEPKQTKGTTTWLVQRAFVLCAPLQFHKEKGSS
jgi:hypothetical protein